MDQLKEQMNSKTREPSKAWIPKPFSRATA
jgi:hypothetical protein